MWTATERPKHSSVPSITNHNNNQKTVVLGRCKFWICNPPRDKTRRTRRPLHPPSCTNPRPCNWKVPSTWTTFNPLPLPRDTSSCTVTTTHHWRMTHPLCYPATTTPNTTAKPLTTALDTTFVVMTGMMPRSAVPHPARVAKPTNVPRVNDVLPIRPVTLYNS